MGSVSLCRDEDNSSPHLPCQADPLSGSDGCCLVPLLSPGGGSPTAVPGGLLAPGTVGVCGSMAAGHTRNPDSWKEPPRGIRRSPALSTGSGPFIRGPHAAACQRLHGRLVGSPACGLVLEEFSGGNWMVSASPRYAGGAAVTGRLVRPFHLTTFYPLGGRAPGLKPRVALP
ncbi:hypothetical protein N7530_012885 [Penicillium desertorum]|uniref:Uncharacterized protein n=1 Tax=Penicillium desertorum TaxID=1303715 RepID=A0A9X0BFJ4_9EURO|nr:hypothetical protein N7530_012885 [Penicillium desertorum]